MCTQAAAASTASLILQLSHPPTHTHKPRGPDQICTDSDSRCSYTNRSSFQKTTSTMEWGAAKDLLSEWLWGPQGNLGFSYKAKHRSL